MNLKYLYFPFIVCLATVFLGKAIAQQQPFTATMLSDKTPETIHGKVVDLWKAPASKTQTTDVSILVVETKNNRVLLQLGPTWAQNEYDKYFKKGQAIAAVGFRFEFKGKPLFVPREVKMEDKIFFFPVPVGIGYP